MDLVWFRGHKWITNNIKINHSIVIFGRLNWFGGKPSIPHPEVDTDENLKKKL